MLCLRPLKAGHKVRASSEQAYLVDVLVFSAVDMSFANASVTLRLEVEVSSLAVVNSYNSGSTPYSTHRTTVSEGKLHGSQ